jgi:hypothetical protein
MFGSAPRAIDCVVRVQCVVHFLYGWHFDWGLCGLCCSSNGRGGFGHKILSPAGVVTAELSVLFTALRRVAEVIRPPERFLILTDSLRLIKAMMFSKIAHQTCPLLYECKQLCWSLCQNGIEVKESNSRGTGGK